MSDFIDFVIRESDSFVGSEETEGTTEAVCCAARIFCSRVFLGMV